LRERAFAGDRDAAEMYVETVGEMSSAEPGTRARKIYDDEKRILIGVSSDTNNVRCFLFGIWPYVDLPEFGDDVYSPEKRQYAQELLTGIMRIMTNAVIEFE
jgi:hypothetical protein